MAPLLILTGANSIGKSTLIQAMLLMKAAFNGGGEKGKIIPLNSEYLNLCDIDSVFSYGAYGGPLSIEVVDKNEKGRIELDVDQENMDKGADQYLIINEIEVFNESIQNLFSDEATGVFTYLSAERCGPRDYQERQFRGYKLLNIGSTGQYCAELIESYGNTIVENTNMVITEIESVRYPKTLLKQIEAWMYRVGFPLELRTEPSKITGVRALRFRDKNSRDADWVSPVHVGFGISYCLPIVVAGLLARPGGIFIVDSPEAHLHPAAQSEIAKFLARLAATGVQVIIETHSDHVLNGIRISYFKDIIQRAAILFLSFSNEKGELKIDEIEINEDGALTKWPSTFFDQLEMDLASIARARKNGARINE